MDLRKLQRVVVDALEDVKAQDIRVYNTAALSSLFERMVIASGTSNRQTRALASRVRERVKEAGGQVISIEGEESGEWVLVDLGDVVVHIMQPAIRSYYNLEELWGAKPVRVKLGAPARVPAAMALEGGADDRDAWSAQHDVDSGMDRQATPRAARGAPGAAQSVALRPASPRGSGGGKRAPAASRSAPSPAHGTQRAGGARKAGARAGSATGSAAGGATGSARGRARGRGAAGAARSGSGGSGGTGGARSRRASGSGR